MKNNKFKKGLSLFLTVLMLMSCWVFIPGEHNHASAALGNVESHQGEVTGYVTVDPVIYIHGDNSSGDQYDYMNYGSVVSDGSYNGEYKTAVSVSGKTISSVTVTDTGATLGISGGVLTGNMSGGYGGETLFSTNSTATLKFTFTDGTFEYHKLAVKPNPVDQHAIALALNSNSSRRRMVSFEVLAKGSAGQNSGGSSNGNSSWIYRYNFPSMYQPFNTSYITDNQSSNPLIGGITSSQISADKVAGYAGSQRVSGSGDSVSITVTSPTAHYYLDLSSNKNLGVNLNGSNWSIDMLVGNLAMSSNYYGTGIGYKSHSLSNSSHTFAYSNTAGDLASSEAFSSGARAEGIVTIGGTQTTAGEISGNLSLTYDHGGSSSYHATATVVMPYYIVVVNKAALRNRYNEIVAQKLQSGNYTQTSWENFKSALLQAEVYLNNSTSGTSDEATLLSNLNTAYSNLKKRNFDINYDNLFSFSEWAASDCTNANATDRGSITYDIAKGTITAVDNSSNTSSNDLFTKYGLGSNLYTVPVKENTEYYLDFDVSATGGQCYIFYYSDSAAVNGSDGNPHTSLGAASGAKKFTTPAGCTKLGIRFGTAANGASVTFSNIRVYEADKKALIDAYKANGVPARTAYNYGDALNAGVVATPLRPGYKFEGWMIESDYSVLFNEDTLLSDFYGGYNFSASWIVYSNWNDILNDVNYDNLFSFSDWARSSSSTLNYATRAKISIDGENGSVTVTDISTVDGGGTYVDGNGVTQDYKDIYTKYSAAAGYYTIPVEGGTAYQFKYNISALSGQGQFFAFYYKYVNGAYQPAYNAGSTSNHWKGSYPTKTGEQIFEFTTPSDATHIQIRLGTSTDGASATYKDIRLYKSSDADKVASITYPNSQREYAASDYQTPTRSGYTFGGWYTDADYTTKATVNDLANSVTVYSKWTSNKYRVLFDNLLDIAKWTPSGSNATVEKTASGKGVKLVSNAGAGEGTCETAAFPVEAGKKYQVDIDFTGDNWDVYIFFRNETTGGTGIEFSDGATRRFSSNEGTGVKADSAIFTAPTGATKAVLRLDANGANNTVTFDNIRIFEVGKGEYGVSAELGQDVTFGSAYGSLPTPTRTGYTFAGWVNADGNAETATSVVDYAGTEILYSTWTVNKYTVKFVNAAGVTVSTATYDYGTAASDVKKAINTTANYDSTNHYSYSWPTINNVTGDVTYTEIKTTTAHTISSKITTAAACTTAGVRTYTCSGCAYSYTESIAATGHTFGATTAAKAATCLAAGNEAYKQCTVCDKYFAGDAATNATEGKADTSSFVIAQKAHSYTGAVKSDGNGKTATHSFKCVNGCNNYGGAVTHTWNSGSVTTAATCLTGGTNTYTCTVSGCGATYTETISATGHTFGTTTAAKAATCLAAGNEAYKQCTVCSKYFADDAETNSTDGKADTSTFVIAQKSHSYTGAVKSDGNGKTATHSFKCVNGCNNYGAAVEHTWGEGVEDPESDCENTGIMTYTCTVNGCGATYEETTNSKGHTLGEWIEEVPAICNKTGVKGHYECSVCHKYFESDKTTVIVDLTIVIDPDNHNWIKGATVAPTCTDQGYTNYKCSYCDSEVAKDLVDALNHDYGTATYTWADDNSSCTATRVCSRDESHTETATATVTSAVKTPATCTAKGTTTYTAEFEADWTKEQTKDVEDIAALNHEYGEVTYKWSDDNSTCTATRVCNRDAKHTETATATVTSEITTPATCTAMGTTNYTAEFAESWAETQSKDVENIAALTHNWSTWSEVTAATCLDEGEEKRTCQREGCDAFETQAIEKLAHSYTGDYGWDSSAKTHTQKCVNGCNEYGNETACTFDEVVTDPTCYVNGYTTYTCKVCKNGYQANFTTRTHVYAYAKGDGTSHNVTCEYDNCDYTAAENCSGGTAYCNALAVCENCNTEWGSYNADNHTSTETYLKDEKTGNCGVEGYTGDTYHKCCDALKEKGKVISATGNHSYGGFDHDDGKSTHSKECSVCGNTVTENCTASDWITDVTATCMEKGSKYKECTVCTYEMEREEIPTTDHNFGGDAVNKGDGKHYYQCQNTLNTGKQCAEYGNEESCSGGTATCTDKAECEKCGTEYGTSLGHNYVGVVTKDPTCTEKGVKTYTCQNDASHTYEEEVAANGHTLTEVDAKAPTCEETGWEAYEYCSVCDYTTYEEIEATDHDYVGVVTKDPTCTEKGVKTYTCKNDASHTYEEEIAANGHTLTKVDAKAPTCEDIGWEAYEYCSVCDYTTYEEIKATDHDYVGVVTKDPTCTEKGIKTYTCKNDVNHTYEEDIAANGHTLTSVDAKAPTCEDIGWEAYEYCTVCTYTTYKETAALTHDYVDITYKWSDDNSVCTATRVCSRDESHTETATAEVTSVVKTPATCTEKGTTTYTATFTESWAAVQNKDVKDIAVDSSNHAGGTYINDEDIEEGTCISEKTWNEVTYCSGCKVKLSIVAKTGEKDENNHVDLKQVDAKAATCEEIGWSAYEYCSKCTYTTYVEIPKLGHDYDETKSEDNLKRPELVDGTWTKGYYTYTCKNNPLHTKKEEVDRASYTAYEAAWNNLESLLSTDITDAAKTAINTVLTDNDIAENLIASEQSTVDTAEANLKAAFEQYKGSLKTYKVTFKIDGSSDVVVEVISGNDALAPQNPTKNYDETYHYEFTGWNKEFTNITSDLTVTAEFDAVEHSFNTHTDKNDTYHTDKCACGYEKDVEHSYTSEVTKKASCDADGVRTYTCSVCNGTKAETITKRTHNIVDTTVALEPTCSATGIMNQKCDNAEDDEYEACGYTTTRVMDKVETAHKWETEYTVDVKASCEANGSKSYHCEYCDEINADSVVAIEKRDHVYKDNGVVTAATCLAAGTMNTICTNAETETHKACTHESTREIPQLSHSYTGGKYTWDETKKTHKELCVNGCNEYGDETECTFDAVVTKATCYAEGYTTHTCTVCNNSYKDTYTSRKHIYKYAAGNGTEHVVTCEYEDCAFEVTENCSGGTAYCNAKAICEKCNTRYGSVDEDNHTNLVKTNYKAATCTENGNKEYWTCEGCNKLYSDEKAKTETNAADVVIAALSHDWKATTYIWAENGSSCTATRECGRDADHTQTLKATITAEITTPATCTEKGTRTYTATFTEDWAETQNKALVDVVAPGHAFDETVEAKDATCIATGNEEYKQCTVCKKYFAEDAEANSTDGKADISSFVIEIDSDNHVNKTEYGKQDSTCTKPGYVAGVYCEDCGEWISGREEIEAKGHNFSEWKSNGDGTHTRTCTACTDEEDRIETEDCSGGTAYCNAKAICEKCNTGYGAKDPSNHSGQADVVKGYVPATCLEEGYSGDIHWSCCDVIYKVGKILPVNAANHTWESDGEEENWIVIKEATCTEEGIKICYCALSKDHYKQVKIPKKDHEYKATVVAPTCVNSGYTNHKCTECNTSYDDTYIDVLGHNHVSVVTPPTCEEDGYTTYTCSRCDDSYVDDYVAANHPDKDGDGNCDNCEGDRVAMCTCLCHSRNWFMKIIYKILNFIWKLFKVNAVCGCGNTHY